MSPSKTRLESYAGVPHLKGDEKYNRLLARFSKSTIPRNGAQFGGFSGLFDLAKLKLRHPLLVSTTDGVGTKLEIARLARKHDTIGIDLVAMSVNDLITCGAKPLFFLDYFATGAFDRKRAAQVLSGIARGCRESNCALVGGETAIMPGFYADSTYDLAGFSVGVVERSKVIDGKRVKKGHVLLGLASSGVHSNGFSLVRKVFTRKELSGTIGRTLLTPTRIYVKPVLDVIRKVSVDAVCHVTGGGFYDNLPRVLPRGLAARIAYGSWPVSDLFREIQKRSRTSDRQMYRTFNMGIGMVLILRGSELKVAKRVLKNHRVKAWEIGTIQKGSGVSIQ